MKTKVSKKKLTGRVEVKKYRTITGYSFGGYKGEIIGIWDEGPDWINYEVYPDSWLVFGEPKKGAIIENGEHLINL